MVMASGVQQPRPKSQFYHFRKWDSRPHLPRGSLQSLCNGHMRKSLLMPLAQSPGPASLTPDHGALTPNAQMAKLRPSRQGVPCLLCRRWDHSRQRTRHLKSSLVALVPFLLEDFANILALHSRFTNILSSVGQGG